MTIQILDSKELREFSSELQRLRECDGATVALCRHSFPERGPDAALTILKALARSFFETNPNMDKLVVMNRDVAVEKATFWLSTGLAYRDEAMNAGEARRMVNWFLTFFKEPECYSNVSLARNSWSPVTTSTFDAALLVVDRDTAGFLCVVDED